MMLSASAMMLSASAMMLSASAMMLSASAMMLSASATTERPCHDHGADHAGSRPNAAINRSCSPAPGGTATDGPITPA
jgi:hypothetical protein